MEHSHEWGYLERGDGFIYKTEGMGAYFAKEWMPPLISRNEPSLFNSFRPNLVDVLLAENSMYANVSIFNHCFQV